MSPRLNIKAALERSRERKLKKPRVTIIGGPGIGKTTFAASAPNAIIIKTEQGCDGLNVPSLPVDGVCETWDELLAALRLVRDEGEQFEWCVIDSITGAQRLCRDKVCREEFKGQWFTRSKAPGYNSFNNGAKISVMHFEALTTLLDEIREQGKGIIMLGHEGIHKSSDSSIADYTRTGGDMETQTWDMLVQWSDQVARACRDIRSGTLDGERKAKARMINSERWLVFDGGPAIDAKCRAGYDMPAKILFGWDEYAARLAENSVDVLIKQVVDLLTESDKKIQTMTLKRLEAKDLKAAAKRIAELPTPRLQMMANWLLSQKSISEEEN